MEKKISINDHILDDFEFAWRQADENGQLALIEHAATLSPGLGVVPILAGMDSYHFSVRSRSREVLFLFKSSLIEMNSGQNMIDPLMYGDFIRETALFSARIYNVLKLVPPIQEIRLYLEILLECGGRGPHYAWRFCKSGAVALHTLNNLMVNISETGRLALASQFLDSSPSFRRRFAIEFKRLFRGITQEASVIHFLTNRFDMEKDADPFIGHLPADLRNPRRYSKLAADSQDPVKRASAIKSLAMVIPKVYSSLMIRMLIHEREVIVQKAVLKVVEASPVGTYPELYPYLYKLVIKFRNLQSMNAFKALVMTQSIPLYRLMDKIREEASWLIPKILKEISSLSKISFFFIRELAVNEAFYVDTNRDIYQALVLGMIRKRPERILRILGKHDNHPDETIRVGIFKLARNINICLARERQEMETQFDAIAQLHGCAGIKKEKKSFIRKILSTPLEKRIRALKMGCETNSLDARGELLIDEDFSSIPFPVASIFNKSIFKDSDLSDTSFFNACFRGAVLFNINLDGAVFEGCAFDDAVLAHVTLKKARFINCSFRGAWIYNSNFERTQILDGLFVDAVIAKTTFEKANLTGSTFVAGKLISSSFEDAEIMRTDFSGMAATFTNFPSLALSRVQGEMADFNARTFQFQAAELPKSLFYTWKDQDFRLAEIDLAIVSEYLYAGRLQFLKQNRFSLMTAYDLFKPRQGDFIFWLTIYE